MRFGLRNSFVFVNTGTGHWQLSKHFPSIHKSRLCTHVSWNRLWQDGSMSYSHRSFKKINNCVINECLEDSLCSFLKMTLKLTDKHATESALKDCAWGRPQPPVPGCEWAHVWAHSQTAVKSGAATPWPHPTSMAAGGWQGRKRWENVPPLTIPWNVALEPEYLLATRNRWP